ncbi:MAG: hypothetical protein HYR64_04045 [Fimbriimonas ginsengisoli]|uniref:FtsK domain-containing protein n=1 Tax=Fimbriimonas ginsengisoli TaxID=1005039 RepID=A0A931LV44_FIMGI|nr:hypothetical protein [Fimbriimonas ginsengisoli]
MKVDIGPSPLGRRRLETVRHGAHRASDIGGVLLITFAVVVALSLALSNVGVLGGALGLLFRTFFGKGSWLVPALLLGLGLSVIRGRRMGGYRSLSWGLGLLFLAVIGSFAGPARDVFDPEIVATSGGYVGSIVSWLFSSLLGDARFVGLGALGLVGVILCANTPLRHTGRVVRNAAEDARTRRDMRKSRPRAVRSAVVRMDDGRQAEELRRARVAPMTKELGPAGESATLAVGTSKEGYELPSIALLSEPSAKPKRSPQEMQRNIETLESTLEEFGIEANVVEVAAGPTVTRYEIQLGPGVRVARITALADNLAMNLAASHVRVEAPIPGKAAIGVEVPNAQPSPVSLREACDSREFFDHPSRLCIALGQDVSGANKYADLCRMPHLLIGGATNSGKSIGLAAIITSLLMRNTPKDLRFVMIDPKRVELSLFDGIPHLLCPVIKDVKEAPGVLRAVWREMDRRYDQFSQQGVRNIDGWNERASFQDRMPYIVLVIDELADLMIQSAAEVETSICRIAQLSRATGIHLVIATQRPSVDVITGTIKANIASRIAFTVSSQVDSRTILDQKGAESLIGRGDMLFLPIDASKPLRVQGAYVSEREIDAVCQFWRAQEQPACVLTPVETGEGAGGAASYGAGEDLDALWEEAVRWVADRGQASTSMMQRRFSIGFQRASRILDQMEERQIVGPRDGPRPREVLITPHDADAIFGGQPYGETGWVGDE